MCVVDGDEGRAMKARKPMGGMSCDVTHGRGLKACTPEAGFKSKQLWLICVKNKQTKRVTRQRKYVKVSLLHLWSFAFFSLHLFTLQSQGHNSTAQPHTRCTAAIYSTQYVHSHTHTTYNSVPLPHSSCLVCFEYKNSNETVSTDDIVANWLFGSMNHDYTKQQMFGHTM